MSSDNPEVIAARLQAAVADPLVTAVEDSLNFRLTAEPGSSGMVGRLHGDLVTVWRRGSGTWVGLNRFTGQLSSAGSGTQLTGVVRLRWIARVASGLLLVFGLVGVTLVASSWDWAMGVAEMIFWAFGGLYFGLVQVRDRQLLLRLLRDTLGAQSAEA